MDTATFKLVAIGLIFLVGMAGGLAALGAARSRAGEIFLALGSALAAGVFLGAALVHLLPDSNEALTGYFAGLVFPLSFLLTAVGFLFILYLEKILLGGRHDHDAPQPGRGLSSYALAIVLSVHSVLTGAALGSENTLAGSAVILLAVVAHKGAAGFALVVDFQRAGFPRREVLVLLTLFSVMTPLGVVFGAVLDHFLEAIYGRLFEGMFDALAAGTFLYIAVLEILAKEFAARERLVAKFAFVSLGLCVMALIALWV